MIKANIEARIESTYKELEAARADHRRLSNLIIGLNKQKAMLEEHINDLSYKLDELKEELDNE